MKFPVLEAIFVLLLLAGIVVLQVFLSKRPSKWPGLILPVFAFLFSLIYPLNMAVSDGDLMSFVLQLLIVWLVGNIPTFLLLLIYFGCREKQRRKKQMDKMNIQDLD